MFGRIFRFSFPLLKEATVARKDVSEPQEPKTWPGTRLGKDFHATRANLPASKFNPIYQRNSMSESLGDAGGFSTIDHSKYDVILHPDDKGTPHGFDTVLRERATGRIIVREHKGQNAGESKLQQEPDKWIRHVNEKTINRQGHYARSTQREVEASKIVDQAMRDGHVEYQVHRTFVDGNGRTQTVIERQVRVYEHDRPAQGGPVRTSVISPDKG
jgi:hypothetical protein